MLRSSWLTRSAQIAAGLVLVLLMTACASTASTGGAAAPQGTVAPAGGKQVRIQVRDNSFEPSTVKVAAGQPVTVVFVNEGKNVHEVEIKDLVKETKLQPGESRQFTITPAKKSYKMYCEIHEDQGMVGEFVAE